MTGNASNQGTMKEEVGSESGSRDAISYLPQEVLGDILSLVSTKVAASTSLLSKKWRYVFALAHNLDFDDSDLLHPEEGKGASDLIWKSFGNFVYRILTLQCACPVKKFSLKYHIDDKSSMAHACCWICNAVERGVLEVDVSMQYRFKPLPPRENGVWIAPVVEGTGGVFLPPQLCTSKTLVKLSLGTRIHLHKLPTDLCLPSLKSLFIDSVVFEYLDLCNVLLPGCPVLEELTVWHEFDLYPYSISSRTIKRLTACYTCESGIDYLSLLSLDAPSLVTLEYADFALSEYPLVNLESLVEASVDIYYSEKIKKPDISGLITGISNVKSLHLSPNSVNVISRCVKDGLILPVFNNLAKFSFGSYNKRGWKLLPYLLKQSPKLETLIIQGLNGYKGDVNISPFQVKELDVLGYRGSSKELEHLKGFLGGTECLEKVLVEFPESLVVDRDIWRQTHRDLASLVGVVGSRCKFEVTHFN